jgi:hypothetical protein
MPQFDASGIVEGLECKLRPYAEFDGVIPEPTDQQIGEFLSRLKKVLREAQDKLGRKDDTEEIDVTDTAQVAKALDDLDPEDFVKIADEMAALHADLCSGTPSKAQILAVPLRRRNLFYQWLQGEVMSPEAASPGGNGQVRTLPRRASA